MSTKWKYFFASVLPWASMLSIEKNAIAFATFFLQISVIGWIPAALWARAELKKHLEEEAKSQETAKPGPKTTAKPDADENTQEIIKSSKATAAKKTTATKKTKSTTKKTTASATSKTKAKPKAKPKA